MKKLYNINILIFIMYIYTYTNILIQTKQEKNYLPLFNFLKREFLLF